ncbi:iron chelate uptake ABC transporter family permease subunit [Conexibacter sp. SYSU D00693]|uniref:FecCD family ABC transporter permease n=1 Tax=Conexibacter sp. SYSU D00693 TaxID=2812560 RepID=UPI00196AB84B|nr:iron chelate uptake ABC transporter family permease subunit [Conexibacter sp. SYSU D00693]
MSARAHKVALRRGPLSLRFEPRAVVVGAALTVAMLAALTVDVGRGELDIAPLDVLKALVGAGDEATSFVVVDLRLPRALVALLIGVALGVAGAIFQDISRNPLVAPDIIGVSHGAALAAVSFIVLFDSTATYAVPGAALAGALVAGVVLYALAWRNGMQGYRLVLVGIGVAAVLQAGIAWVLTQGQVLDAALAYIWIVGSLNGRDWDHVWPLLGTVAVLVPLALLLARQLQVLQLGDEVARALGANVERQRLGLLLIALVLVGVAVAAGGPIAFTAFIAPHIARRLTRSVTPLSVLPVAALVGATLVCVADTAGRLLFSPDEIPVGIVTSIIAAPYFLYLLSRANRLGVTG